MIAALALTLALQPPAAAPPARPAAATPPSAPAPAAQAPARRAASTTATLQVRVTDRTGAPAAGVQVSAEGPVSRDGTSDASGQVQLRTLTSGTYRLRATADRYITLEKEVTVRGGSASISAELTLTPAPPPPAAPTPVPEPASPAPASSASASAVAGDSRVLSIADLAERSLSGRDAVKRVPVACSGLDRTQMIVLRDTLQVPATPDLDRMLYVVAGEAMLSMEGREQPISSGWYVMVPRGTAHTVTRRGRNPIILLETAGGEPCSPK